MLYGKTKTWPQGTTERKLSSLHSVYKLPSMLKIKKIKINKKFRYLLWAAFIALMLARIPETNNLKQTKWS